MQFMRLIGNCENLCLNKPATSSWRDPISRNKACKAVYLCVKPNVDSFEAFLVSCSNLATSFEESANHFAVGAALITHFFFVYFTSHRA